LSNKAASKGGVMYYSDFRPIFKNNTYNNGNTALYGNRIGSFPISIKEISTNSSSIEISKLASGQPISIKFELGIYDYDNQLMNLLSGSRVVITPVNSTALVAGVGDKLLINGTTLFEGLVLKAIPGKTGFEYNIRTSSIDIAHYLKVFNETYTDTKIIGNFRN
jgi:hypothetical protein